MSPTHALKMTYQEPVWSLKDILLNRNDKTAGITVVCKRKWFRIQLSPSNFAKCPQILRVYIQMMDSVLDDDYEVAETAEHDLQKWAIDPFLAIFDKIESPSSRKPVTLQQYLAPEIYRYILCGSDGRLEPFLDYTVPEESMSDGVNLNEVTLSPSWRCFCPRQIEIQSTNCDEHIVSPSHGWNHLGRRQSYKCSD